MHSELELAAQRLVGRFERWWGVMVAPFQLTKPLAQLSSAYTSTRGGGSDSVHLQPLIDCLLVVFVLLQYCRDRKHAKPMWFCVTSCHILWFTFTKAIFNVLKKKITGTQMSKLKMLLNDLCQMLFTMQCTFGRVL